LFPYAKVRKVQREMINSIKEALELKKHVLIHAPTGIGKTVAALAPCLSFALKNKKTLFFLTSKHMQHLLAINTLKDIKKKYDIDFLAVDLIGKKYLCSVKGIDSLNANEFNDFCKKQREEKLCLFYNKTKKDGKLSFSAKKVLEELSLENPFHIEKAVEICKKNELCCYEILLELCKNADVIIADYNYLFHPYIRDAFFSKINKKLNESIVIVDEAHNLPKRLREMMSFSLTTFMLRNAIKEAERFGFDEIIDSLNFINDTLFNLAVFDNDENEKLIKKEKFVEAIESKYNYEGLISDFIFFGEKVREEKKRSFIFSIGVFLNEWLGNDEGFVRIIEKEGDYVKLSYRCLDPSFISKDIVDSVYTMVLMSGTLTPTFMYRDLLGFENALEKEFGNPFPSKNRLCLIVPETTTRYTRRGDKEYKKIADVCKRIFNSIEGNVVIFFPSYEVMKNVFKYFYSEKIKVFIEKQGISKEEKQEILEEFKRNKEQGSVLFAVSSGNFGEGIDLPGDLLKGVIVVGLPLEKPCLEVKELIAYYDKKFGKGLEYGYVYPAIIRVLQNAGRCIRSEKDKGVIVFLDERFIWERYLKCFPKDMNFRIIKDYERLIRKFFS